MPAQPRGDVMKVLHRNSKAPAPTDAVTPEQVAAPPPAAPSRETITRTSAAWVGICTAAVTLVVLIVFMLQNTGSVEVTFLSLHGSLPLAMALLIAGVGAAILTMSVGAARITQLQRRSRRDHRTGA